MLTPLPSPPVVPCPISPFTTLVPTPTVGRHGGGGHDRTRGTKGIVSSPPSRLSVPTGRPTPLKSTVHGIPHEVRASPPSLEPTWVTSKQDPQPLLDRWGCSLGSGGFRDTDVSDQTSGEVLCVNDGSRREGRGRIRQTVVTENQKEKENNFKGGCPVLGPRLTGVRGTGTVWYLLKLIEFEEPFPWKPFQ